MSEKEFEEYFSEGSIKGNTYSINSISVRGEAHKREGQPNQDAFSIKADQDSICIAVADGLGACEKSNIGARYAVECVQECVEDLLREFNKISTEVVSILIQTIIESWKEKINSTDRHLYDTTILFILIYKDQLIIGGIGDGMILYNYDKKNHDVLKQDKAFCNQTQSINSVNALMNAKIGITGLSQKLLPLTIILTSDGISDDLEIATREQLPNYLFTILKENDVEFVQKELREWIIEWKTEGHLDDRTFCMLNIK